jgi:hypothetical protein
LPLEPNILKIERGKIMILAKEQVDYLEADENNIDEREAALLAWLKQVLQSHDGYTQQHEQSFEEAKKNLGIRRELIKLAIRMEVK